jgi:hypothetical protein
MLCSAPTTTVSPSDRFTPAGFHVAQHDRSLRPELDDLSWCDIVHELDADDPALHILDDCYRHLGSGRRRQAKNADNGTNQALHGTILLKFPAFWDTAGRGL